MLLFINACARRDSRTLVLAERLRERFSDECEVLGLYETNLRPLDYKSLQKREKCIFENDFRDEMFSLAKQFSQADKIIIAAPYWDLSFPSVLKCYFEAVCVNGLVFSYNEHGIPEGLCRAKVLYYVTTAGGFIPEKNFGYDYVKQLCSDFFGIKNTACIKAEGLDIIGADVNEILTSAEKEIDNLILL